jgi:predicted nucleic acid-binding protein
MVRSVSRPGNQSAKGTLGMPEFVTLDSSVIIAALRKQEEYSQSCQTVLQKVMDGSFVAVEPYTVLIEISAAMKRRTGSQELSERVVRDLQSISNIFFLDLDAERATQAVVIAQRSSLRGMDAVVAQISQEFNATLISLDIEMLESLKNVLKTSHPVFVR